MLFEYDVGGGCVCEGAVDPSYPILFKKQLLLTWIMIMRRGWRFI